MLLVHASMPQQDAKRLSAVGTSQVAQLVAAQIPDCLNLSELVANVASQMPQKDRVTHWLRNARAVPQTWMPLCWSSNS